jgi:hypothetical protein
MKGKGMPALVLSFGGVGGPKGRSSDEDGDEGMAASSPGGMAIEAFCRAKDAGDYDTAWAAFKEAVAIADEEDGEDEGEEGKA